MVCIVDYGTAIKNSKVYVHEVASKHIEILMNVVIAEMKVIQNNIHLLQTDNRERESNPENIGINDER